MQFAKLYEDDQERQVLITHELCSGTGAPAVRVAVYVPGHGPASMWAYYEPSAAGAEAASAQFEQIDRDGALRLAELVRDEASAEYKRLSTGCH